MSHLISWAAHMSLDVLPETSSRFIPDSTWINVIAPEVMRQCDAVDGVRIYARPTCYSSELTLTTTSFPTVSSTIPAHAGTQQSRLDCMRQAMTSRPTKLPPRGPHVHPGPEQVDLSDGLPNRRAPPDLRGLLRG